MVLSTWRTLGEIKTIFPPSTTFVRLNDLVNTYHYWGDDDGDGQGTNGVTATGTLWLSLHDKNGDTVRPNDRLDACKAPYRVTIGLNPDGASLTTQYGVPNRRVFSTTNDREYYYFKPNANCLVFMQSARPNLLYGGTTGINSSDNPRYAGPSNIWSPTKGFLTQSTRSSSYDQNFPTTGADGLYFDLEMPTGVNASQLTWSVVTNGDITATVTSVTPSDSWIPSVDRGKVVARVKLSGPRADSARIRSDYPSPLDVPTLPQTFELVGRDSDGNGVKYGFVLKQWFVNRGISTGNRSRVSNWCSNLGYRLARVRDLTNAVCSGENSGSWCQGSVGATPSSSNNTYMRHIGAGFFTEWGRMINYSGAEFVPNTYWTSDVVSSREGFGVSADNGGVVLRNFVDTVYAVCTTP